MFIIIGLVNGFYGYKLFKILLFIIGFMVSFYLIYKIGSNFIDDKTVVVIIGLILGLIIAILTLMFYFSGIFLVGVVTGIFLGLSLNIPFDQITKVVVIITLGIIIGLLSLIFQKYMIIVITSFLGAFLVVNSLFYIYFLINGIETTVENILIMVKNNTITYIIMLFSTLVLGVIGILFQYRSFKK